MTKAAFLPMLTAAWDATRRALAIGEDAPVKQPYKGYRKDESESLKSREQMKGRYDLEETQGEREWKEWEKKTRREARKGKDAEPEPSNEGKHAAGILFVAPDGDVLLLRRGSNEENYAGHWALPGGKAEDGENPEQAADREAKEEMGRAPEGSKKLLDQRMTPNGMAFRTFAQPVTHKFTPKLNGEHSGYCWSPLHQLPQPLHPAVDETLRTRLGQTKTAKDMTPEDWSGLRDGLMKFLSEEEAEEEHAEDAANYSGTIPQLKENLRSAEEDLRGSSRMGIGAGQRRELETEIANYKRVIKAREASAKDRSLSQDATSEEWFEHGEQNQNRRLTARYGEGILDALRNLGHPVDAPGWAAPPELLDGGEEGSGAEDEQPSVYDNVIIDITHDGPWMSCMSKDGKTMYVNKNLPESANILGKTVIVARVLQHHECPEWDEIRELIAEFEAEHDRKPKLDERKALYLKAHHSQGTPPEREYVERLYGPPMWDAWSAWCRGEEDRVEHIKATNPPPDPDVKPIPHGHGDLEITMDNKLPDFVVFEAPVVEPLAHDSFLAMDRGISSKLSDQQLKKLSARRGMAFDEASVRKYDADGRLHVEMTNISKANICPYLGSEIPGASELGLEPDKIYQLLRDPDELRKAAATFNGIPVLREHLPTSAEDHQTAEVIGSTGNDAVFEDPYLRNSLVIWPKKDIDQIESEEKRELSCAYRYVPKMEQGTFKGVHFDGRMTALVGNHVAVCETGRAGADCYIADNVNPDVGWAAIAKAISTV